MIGGMAYTQTDLNKLDQAIALGILTVQSGEDSVTYRNIDSLIKARAHVAGVLAAQKTGAGVKHSFADFSGFDD